MIVYRTFRNFDPPHLASIWNDAFPNRGSYPLTNNVPFERWVLSKPYFDPAGLFVAVDDNRPVGFAHAGFGPNDTGDDLGTANGVVCIVAVLTAYRRQGIGSELLSLCEEYLRRRGATALWAGAMRPANPFYFGLYGGSDSPGFLTSDPGAGPFLEMNGYVGASTALVFQRRLDQPVTVADPRFNLLKRRYEVQILPRTPVGTWWQECQFSTLEPIEFRLEDKLTGMPAARCMLWEMEGYSWRWQAPSAGLLDLQVRADLRRQGLGRFLVTQILRFLQDQYFMILETQMSERNAPAVGLFRSLGFEQADVGRLYRRSGGPVPTPPEDVTEDALDVSRPADYDPNLETGVYKSGRPPGG